MMKANTFDHKSPNLLLLVAAMDNVIGVERDVRKRPIWQCVMMWNTHDLIDTGFSITGLFGETLPVKAFTKNDRV